MELRKTESETLEILLNPKSKDVVLATINKETPSLIKLRLDSLSQTVGWIAEMLLQTLNQFNIGRNMTDEQIRTCAFDIVDTFPQLNLFDIKTCFKKAEAGFYNIDKSSGKIYHGIDKLVVFEWLYLFEQEKLDLIVKHREKENKNLNVKEPLKALENLAYSKVLMNPNSNGDYKRAEPILENPYQKYFKEFDELHKKRDTTTTGIRYIEYDGLNLTSEEFVMHRFNEDKNPTK